MKRLLAIAYLFLAATTLHAEIRGAWTATVSDKDPQKLHVQMSRKNNNFGNSFRLSEFSGLSASAISSATDAKTTFSLQRDAGVISFEGYFRDGEGAGRFSFAPNAGYLGRLRSMGLKFDDEREEKTEEEQLFRLAMHDVSTEYISRMRAAGYDVSLREYIRFRIFDVTPESIAEYKQLGFQGLTTEQIVRAHIHGATPAFVRSMRAAGFNNLSLDQLVKSRIHGVTPEFAKSIADLGYSATGFDDLVRFRIHGVSPEFIGELRTLGYDRVSPSDLVRMRIHGVTPEFIREIQKAGYSKVPVEKLVKMRIHGVDAKFLKAMDGAQ